MVDLAITPEQREKGLMFREKLQKNSGMLFIFSDEDHRTFWMKNTFIPLDVMFIDKSGKIVDTKEDLQPCPGYAAVCPEYTSPQDLHSTHWKFRAAFAVKSQ